MVDDIFEREKEEDLIPDDRAADVAAEVVEVYRSISPGDAVKSKRCSIQGGVFEIVVPHAVELVRPALADLVIENAAGAVLRREQRIAHLHFGDGVEDRRVNNVIA